jgi:hypothetical protein
MCNPAIAAKNRTQCSDHSGSQFDLKCFEHSSSLNRSFFSIPGGVSWRIFESATGAKIKSIPLGNKSAALSSAGINAAGFLPRLVPKFQNVGTINQAFLFQRSGMDARKDRDMGAIRLIATSLTNKRKGYSGLCASSL